MEKKTDFKERRRYPRLDLNVTVTWERMNSEEGYHEKITNHTKNISAGGICLIVYEKLKKDDILSLVFELPSRKIIHCQGRVCWIKPFEVIGNRKELRYDVGIEFIEISSEDQGEIRKHVFSFLS